MNKFSRGVVEMGVTLAFLQEFAQQVPQGHTSAMVVQEFIRGHTRPWKCR